jgi:very-short-patch-repair endonuclease
MVNHPPIVKRARALRRAQTDPERLLWSKLRNRGLDGAKFRRQEPLQGFVVDFCCLEKRLVIELDGDPHGREPMASRDARRTLALNQLGFRVIRFGNAQIWRELESVLDTIYEALQMPAPSPLPQAEDGTCRDHA